MSEPTPPNVQYPAVAQPPPYSPQGQPVQYVAMPPRRSFLRRFFFTLLVLAFIFSVLLNLGLAVILAGSHIEGKLSRKTLTRGDENSVVAVYHVTGVIGAPAAQQFQTFTREVVSDSKVKAVVLRVDSPGGGIAASDEIWSMVGKLKEHGKKVVVSMGGVAASGGYYISAGADRIFAEETTITGSIGVIMAWLVLERGLDKLGIDPLVLKSTHAEGWKDELSSLKSPDDRQKAHLREVLDTMQARFEKIVKDGRGAKLKLTNKAYTATMPAAGGGVRTVEITETEPLNGKIYMGAEAKALGLVDDIGYMDQAIDAAKKLASLTNPSVIQFERRQSLIEKMVEGQAAAGIKIDSSTLDELTTPRVMVLWQP